MAANPPGNDAPEPEGQLPVPPPEPLAQPPEPVAQPAPPPLPPPLPPAPARSRVWWWLARHRLALVIGAALAGVAVLVASCFFIPRREPEGLRQLAERYGRETGLDPALVLAVIHVESSGRADALSRSGARGLMQLMPATAEEVARKNAIKLESAEALFDPRLNVRLGTLYLAYLRRLFGDDPWLYLAAYNAGMGRVDRWRLQNPGLSSEELVNRFAPAETRAYVPRVLRAWEAAKR